MADDHSALPAEPPMSEDELDAYLDTRPPPAELSEAELAAKDARAEADYLAGRVVSHEAAMRWFESLFTDDPLPRPRWGE